MSHVTRAGTIQVCTHMQADTHIHMCIHAYKHICTCAHMQTSTSVQAHTCTHTHYFFQGMHLIAREGIAGCPAGHREWPQRMVPSGKDSGWARGGTEAWGRGDFIQLLKVFKFVRLKKNLIQLNRHPSARIAKNNEKRAWLDLSSLKSARSITQPLDLSPESAVFKYPQSLMLS